MQPLMEWAKDPILIEKWIHLILKKIYTDIWKMWNNTKTRQMKIRYLNRSIYIIYICRRSTICKNTSLAMPPAIRKISFIFTIKRRFENDIHHTICWNTCCRIYDQHVESYSHASATVPHRRWFRRNRNIYIRLFRKSFFARGYFYVVGMFPCFDFLFANTNNDTVCLVCASAGWFFTIKTMIRFMHRNLFAKGVIHSWKNVSTPQFEAFDRVRLDMLFEA